jgi:hypothetical protein
MNKLVTLGVIGITAISLAGCAPIVEESTPLEAAVVETTDEAQAEEMGEETTEAAQTQESEGSTTTQNDAAVEIAETSDLGHLATEDKTVEMLTYLIEEEKLAHDVYTVLYEMYGSKVFGNILESESTHQDKVMELLDAYGVADPRDSSLGVFNDPDLQALFDQLIAKGSLSAQDAFEVGVMIEEKDIEDITAQLALSSDSQIVSVLESLRSGSENHLRAFNRQL